MKQLIDKFLNIEKEISQEQGALSLFTLLLREESQNKWDIVLSAPWFSKDKVLVLKYIVKKLRKNLEQKTLTGLSRVILLDHNDPFVLNVNSIIKTEHSTTEFKNCQFNNIYVKHAFIITSQKVSKTKSVNDKTIIKGL